MNKWLLLIALFFIPITVGAQFMPSQSSAAITLSPRVPEPNQTVTVALDAYTIDTSGAEIVWLVDGVENTAVKNLRSFGLIAKGLGEETTVDVRVTLPSGSLITANQIITPSRVDLIVEADTLVPSFYKGRPLPSVGSTARVIAIAHTGEEIDRNELTYLWKLDNEVLYGGPLKGRNMATFVVDIGLNQIISVDVTDTRGRTIARKSMVLPLAKPEMHFYVENPLRGLIPRSISSPYIMTGEEVTVRAEPYYMDRDILLSKPLLQWEINGQKTASANFDPQSLTLRKTGGSGSANVSFHIRNLNQLLQGIEDTFTVKY